MVGEAGEVGTGGEEVPDAQRGQDFLQLVGALDGELRKVKLELPGREEKRTFLESSRAPGCRLTSLPSPLSST